MGDGLIDILPSLNESSAVGGPLYVKLQRLIENAVREGKLLPGDALPPERELAAMAEISRVTVRKAVQGLVNDGLLVQRHGSGTFVAPRSARVEQSLSHLTSFTEDMARRGMIVRSTWLDRGVYAPSPEEMVTLGLSSGEKVARISRLRVAIMSGQGITACCFRTSNGTREAASPMSSIARATANCKTSSCSKSNCDLP